MKNKGALLFLLFDCECPSFFYYPFSKILCFGPEVPKHMKGLPSSFFFKIRALFSLHSSVPLTLFLCDKKFGCLIPKSPFRLSAFSPCYKFARHPRFLFLSAFDLPPRSLFASRFLARTTHLSPCKTHGNRFFLF